MLLLAASCWLLSTFTCPALLLLQFGSVDDVLAVYQHQQQLYGFASMGVQTTLIHALLKAHGRGQPGTLLAYEAWGRLRRSGRQLDAQALLAGAADDGSAAGWQGCCLRAAAAAAAGGQARGMGGSVCVCGQCGMHWPVLAVLWFCLGLRLGRQPRRVS